jgi:hypothetical protein
MSARAQAGRRTRQDVGHSPVGKRLHQSRAADQFPGLILRAPVLGQEPLIRADDFPRYQALEQALDTGTS